MSATATAVFTAHATQTGPRPCYKHTRWMASCDDCTTWHLGRQIAARDADTRTAPVLTLVRSADRRPAAALRTAA